MATKTTTKAGIELHLIEPRATEKAYYEQAKRTYIFSVNRDFSKQAVAELIAKEFNVTVTDVRTLTRKGKKTRYSKGKHQYPGTTFRQDKKYAYVTLKEGDKIKVFDEPEEETKKTTAKAAKKAEKDGGKETK